MPTPVFGTPTYYRDSLAEVNAAISAVMNRGQRYRIGDREVWRGDLEWLHSERGRLEPLASREKSKADALAAGCQAGGIRVRRGVPL
jgi:hypothetical protein